MVVLLCLAALHYYAIALLSRFEMRTEKWLHSMGVFSPPKKPNNLPTVNLPPSISILPLPSLTKRMKCCMAYLRTRKLSEHPVSSMLLRVALMCNLCIAWAPPHIKIKIKTATTTTTVTTTTTTLPELLRLPTVLQP